MRKSLLCARLDYLTVKPYLTVKTLLIFVLVGLFIGYQSASLSSLSGVFMGYGVIFCSYPFAIEDRNATHLLYATLPVKRKHLVLGRYLFGLGLLFITGLAAILVSCVFSAVRMKAVDLLGICGSIGVLFIVFSAFLALQFPIYFKLGYTKAKLLAYLPFLGIAAIVFLALRFAAGNESVSIFVKNVTGLVSSNLPIFILISIVTWCGLLALSWLLSIRFYAKREF